MSRLILVTLMFTSLPSHSKTTALPPPPPFPHQEIQNPRVRVTPFEWFVEMPLEFRAKYIQKMRQFLIEQDEKNRRYAFERSLSSPFLDLLLQFETSAEAQDQAVRRVFPENGACYRGQTVPDGISDGVRTLIEKDQDRCVVGGNIVCMVINSSNRMTCRLSDMPETRQALKGSCKEGEIQCAYPLSVSKAGKGPLCFKEKVGLTMDCFGDKAMTSKDVASFIAEKNLKAEYNQMKASVEGYCGPSADKIKEHNYFDKPDCDQLHKWLAGIATEGSDPTTPAKKAFACQFNQPTAQPVTITVSEGVDGKRSYVVEGSGGWTVIGGSDLAFAAVRLDESNSGAYLSLNELTSECGTKALQTFFGTLDVNTGICSLKITKRDGQIVTLRTAGGGASETPWTFNNSEIDLIAQRSFLGRNATNVGAKSFFDPQNKKCDLTLSTPTLGKQTTISPQVQRRLQAPPTTR